jgi:hypothetical protein
MFEKIHTNSKRLLYHLRRDYLTLNNIVFAVAIVIALSWTWSSIDAMQQNYALQQSVDVKKQQLELEHLRVSTLELEGKYYDSYEYQELAVRERLGKGLPGESAVIVPSTDQPDTQTTAATTPAQTSNFQQWMDFLFGSRAKSLQK